MGFKRWNSPPSSEGVLNVDAGQVVSVRIWTTDPTLASILVPDPVTGIAPHVIYIANIPPEGTGAFVDSMTGYQTGDRPLSAETGQIIDYLKPNAPEQIIFRVDMGTPFLCPWAGQIQIEGGAFQHVNGNPSTPVPYQVDVIRTQPQSNTIIEHVIDPLAGPVARQRYREFGNRRVRNPRLTFFGVTSAAKNKVPRGAVSVYSLGGATVNFFPSGAPAAGGVIPAPQISLTVPANASIPIGYGAEGYFSVDALADMLSFEVEIA